MDNADLTYYTTVVAASAALVGFLGGIVGARIITRMTLVYENRKEVERELRGLRQKLKRADLYSQFSRRRIDAGMIAEAIDVVRKSREHQETKDSDEAIS